MYKYFNFLARTFKSCFNVTSICILIFIANFYFIRTGSRIIFDLDFFKLSYISYSFFLFAFVICIIEVIVKEKVGRIELFFQFLISFILMSACFSSNKICCALLFYYHIALNFVFPIIMFIRIFLYPSSKKVLLILTISILYLFCIFIKDFIICRNQMNCINKMIDSAKVDDLLGVYDEIYDVDCKLQSEFNNEIRTNEVYAISGFSDRVSKEYLFSRQHFEFIIPEKVKEQIKLLESKMHFWEIVKKYETMNIDITKYLTFSEYSHDGLSYYSGDDIKCIVSYYMICFYNEMKNNYSIKCIEYYKKLDKWKEIALIRCPSNGNCNDYLMYSYIVNLKLHMLCIMKEHSEHYSDVQFDITDELAKLNNDCLYHYQLSREKLAFLYLIKYCNCISFSQKLFADENSMQRIFTIQGEKMQALKREKMTLTSLLYHEWDTTGLLEWNLIIRNPIFKFWNRMITQQSLVEAICCNKYSLIDSSALNGCYAYFLYQCTQSNRKLNNNLELIESVANIHPESK